MKIRLLVIVTLILLIPSAVIGGLSKSSYTNITAEKEPLHFFSVGLISDNLLEKTISLMEEDLDNCNYILRVKAERDQEFIFLLTKQCVMVQEIYKGEGLKTGEKIEITKNSSYIFYDQMGINMAFVNAMKPGEEYLVFLDSKIDALDPNDNVYITPEYLIAPIFSYNARENTIATPKSKENSSVPYSEVQENEFFVTSQQGIEKLNQLKEVLFLRYPA